MKDKIGNKYIIFLDIDGVLNSQLHYESKQYKDYVKSKEFKGDLNSKLHHLYFKRSQISLERIEMLNHLIKDINAVVVISSTWRLGNTVEQLQEILNFAGASFKIIGKTEHLEYERGIEIAKWLRDNIHKDVHGVNSFDFHKYVIIDDDSDMLLNQRNHFFQTDPYVGLTPTICYKIKKFVTGKTFDK